MPKIICILEKIRPEKPPGFRTGPDFPEFTLCE